jgi:hypothetical protein
MECCVQLGLTLVSTRPTFSPAAFGDRRVLLACIARLLCDGTNLRKGGEEKGKQDGGVLSKPVTATPTQKPAASSQLNCHIRAL